MISTTTQRITRQKTKNQENSSLECPNDLMVIEDEPQTVSQKKRVSLTLNGGK